MKKKGLIFSAVFLLILFSVLVFFTIRLFYHQSPTIQTQGLQKKSTVRKASASRPAPSVIEHTEKKEKTQKMTSPSDKEKSGPDSDDFAEDQREIARMKEALPGNMWIPQTPKFGLDPERSKKLAESIMIADKIRKGTATPKEKITYYKYKIKSAQDRIDIIKYIADRTAQLQKQKHKTYLTEQDRVIGEKKITELEKKIEDYKQILDKIKAETGNDSGR